MEDRSLSILHPRILTIPAYHRSIPTILVAVAERLVLSRRTVDWHLSSIYAKLKLKLNL